MKNNDKKNEDTKNELLAKMKKAVQLNFDEQKVAETIANSLAQMPVLTEEEADELNEQLDMLTTGMVETGCWLGLSMFRKNGVEEPQRTVSVNGNVATLALMISEAMNEYPYLEKAFLLAVGMRMKYGEDNNEE